MRNINDVVEATEEMTFYVPAFHIVKPGDRGQVTNTHADVKAWRSPDDELHPCPNLVRFVGAPGAVWVGDDEIK